MSTPTAILGFDDLAGRLRELDVPTVSATPVPAAARAVRDHLTSGQPLDAIIVFDTGEAFLSHWARSAASRVAGRLLVLHATEHTIDDESLIHMDLPVAMTDVCAALQLDAPEGTASWVLDLVDATPVVHVESANKPGEDEDDWGIPDEEPAVALNLATPTSANPGFGAESLHRNADSPSGTEHVEALRAAERSIPETYSTDVDQTPRTDYRDRPTANPVDQTDNPWISAPEAAASIPASAHVRPPSAPAGPATSKRSEQGLAITQSVLERRREARHRQDESQVDTAAFDFEVDEQAATSRRRAARSKLAPVVIVKGAKGGVGKTSFSVFLPSSGAELGLKVALIDASRGQADISTVLRVPTRNLPTMYEAVIDSPEAAIVTPAHLNEHRHGILPPIKHAVVFGPPPELSDSSIVTADHYRQVIETLRTQSDLVIVDTQIMEASDTSGIFDQVLIPMMREDAWSLAITDLSHMSLRNLKQRLLTLAEDGVPTSRMLSVVNINKRVTRGAGGEVGLDQIGAVLGRMSTYVGHVPSLPEIGWMMNNGDTSNPPKELQEVLHSILHRTTGVKIPEPEPEKKSLLARLFGGR